MQLFKWFCMSEKQCYQQNEEILKNMAQFLARVYRLRFAEKLQET